MVNGESGQEKVGQLNRANVVVAVGCVFRHRVQGYVCVMAEVLVLVLVSLCCCKYMLWVGKGDRRTRLVDVWNATKKKLAEKRAASRAATVSGRCNSSL
jgi:hypothetical protein